MNRTSVGLVAGSAAASARRALACGLLVVAAPAAATAAQPELRPVAISGRAAPDSGGQSFYFFDLPALNDAGQVAFNAWLPNTPGDAINPTGIWSGAPGALRLNALRGAPSPAPNDPPYTGFGTTVAINGDGAVLFSGAFAPREFYPNPTGLFVGLAGDPAAARTVAATQMEAPEARSKQFFDYVDPYPLRLGAGGHVAFTARVAGKEVEERVNDTGVWRAAPGTLQRQLVARAGWQAPGAGEGVVFSEGVHASGVAFHPPVVDRLGNVAFIAHLRGEGVDEFNERGLWYSDVKTGALSLAARHGQPMAPGSSIYYQDISYEPTAANGRVAFHAVMYGPPPRDDAGDVSAARLPSDSERFEVIVTGAPDALKIVAATLTRPAGGDFRFDGLSAPVINSRGDVLFAAALAFDGREDQVGSLWAASASARRMLVQEGDAAPGSGAAFRNVSLPSFNDAGDFVFFGDLAGEGVGDANDRGIWAGSVGDLADPDYGQPSLTLVAREGQVIDLGDGLPRTVRSLEMLTGTNGGEDGAPSALNDAGELAFVARFTDGSSAVLFATVPEPAGAGVLLGLATSILGRRRRRASASCSAGTSSRSRP
jgi:hypothetical protein